MVKTPVIRYEILSRPLKWTLASLVALAFMFVGFVFGIAVAVSAPPAGPPTMIIVPIPDNPKVHPYMPGSFGEPVPIEASRWKYDSLKDEVKCLADNIYFEGRNQSMQGKVGIGLTTINRVKSKHFKDSICEVVWFQARSKKTGKMTAHFSWTLDGKSDKIANKAAYEEIYKIAEAMLAGATLDNFIDFTEGATHYHADYVTPYWSDDYEMVAQIDDHIFYK